MAEDPIEPDIVEEEEALDVRRPDVPITVEEIAALGKDQADAVIQARVQIITTLRAASIRQTRPSDWVLYKDIRTGRVLAYLEDKGAQRVMPLWGIEITRIISPERIPPTGTAEDGTFAYSQMGDGRSKITGQTVLSMEGVRNSGERFAQEQNAGIAREVAVKKAARANLEGRIVRNLAGLNGVPLDELILVSGDKDFERKASKGRGYGNQAERAGAQVQEGPKDFDQKYQPKCETCNTPMQYRPAGRTSTKTAEFPDGKPYDAFWSCPSRDHKYTLKHEQVVAEAKAAHAREASAPTERQPGDEG